MPVTITNPNSRSEPVPGFGFAVQIGDDIKGWFTECSGLSIEREVKAYPEGGVNDYVHQLPGRLKQSNITLKHGLAGNELWDWFQKGQYDSLVECRNVSIVYYDAKLTEQQRWDLVNVFPVKWTGPTFNSANNEVAVETIEFTYAGGGQSSRSAVQRMPENGQNVQAEPPQQDIDLPALAEKIYALLKQELRVERERLGWIR